MNQNTTNTTAIDNAINLVKEVRDVLSTILENYPTPQPKTLLPQGSFPPPAKDFHF